MYVLLSTSCHTADASTGNTCSLDHDDGAMLACPSWLADWLATFSEEPGSQSTNLDYNSDKRKNISCGPPFQKRN